MAKTPTKTTDAPAKAAPKMGAAAPKKPETAPAKPTDTATDKPTDPAAGNAAGDAAGVTTFDGPGQAQTQTGGAHSMTGSATTDDVEAAYKEGYSNGFSAALDELAEEQGQNENPDDRNPDAQAGQSTFATIGDDYLRARLVTLALFTPENQRKGGLHVIVGRLEDFVSGLPEEDRDAAVMFMGAIAQTSPLDLATGRFKLLVIEGLEIVAGTTPGASGLTPAESGEAAANRLTAAMPDLEDVPEGLTAEETDPHAGVNLEDPDDPRAAAARLGMA